MRHHHNRQQAPPPCNSYSYERSREIWQCMQPAERSCLQRSTQVSVLRFAVAMRHMTLLRTVPSSVLLVLLASTLPDAAHACCKMNFIRQFNLTHTALAVNMTGLTVDEARRAHIVSALSFVPSLLYDDPKALRLEFGVRNGKMINFMSTHTRVPRVGLAGGAPDYKTLPWDGFDSFRGLPKSTSNAAGLGWGRGKYSVGGNLPDVPAHVRLHVGWFNVTRACAQSRLFAVPPIAGRRATPRSPDVARVSRCSAALFGLGGRPGSGRLCAPGRGHLHEHRFRAQRARLALPAAHGHGALF